MIGCRRQQYSAGTKNGTATPVVSGKTPHAVCHIRGRLGLDVEVYAEQIVRVGHGLDLLQSLHLGGVRKESAAIFGAIRLGLVGHADGGAGSRQRGLLVLINLPLALMACVRVGRTIQGCLEWLELLFNPREISLRRLLLCFVPIDW